MLVYTDGMKKKDLYKCRSAEQPVLFLQFEYSLGLFFELWTFEEQQIEEERKRVDIIPDKVKVALEYDYLTDPVYRLDLQTQLYRRSLVVSLTALIEELIRNIFEQVRRECGKTDMTPEPDKSKSLIDRYIADIEKNTGITFLSNEYHDFWHLTRMRNYIVHHNKQSWKKIPKKYKTENNELMIPKEYFEDLFKAISSLAYEAEASYIQILEKYGRLDDPDYTIGQLNL